MPFDLLPGAMTCFFPPRPRVRCDSGAWISLEAFWFVLDGSLLPSRLQTAFASEPSQADSVYRITLNETKESPNELDKGKESHWEPGKVQWLELMEGEDKGPGKTMSH